VSTLADRTGLLRQDANASIMLPVRGAVLAVNPDRDAVSVSLSQATGNTDLSIRHPYVGVNSWIRTIPEIGTELLMQPRGDTAGNIVTGYSFNSAANLIVETRKERALLRSLNPGEIELMSAGRAYMYLGDRGDIELRGGTIRLEMLQSELELASISPTYRRRLHLNSNTKLAHEERFGIVKRKDTKNPNTVTKYVRLLDLSFAVEYSRWLNAKTGDTLLCSLQEGNVINENGLTVKHPTTTKDLRLQYCLGHKDTTSITTISVDEELNLLYDNSSATTKEAVFKFGSLSVLDISADSFKLTMNKTGDMKFPTSLTITSNTTNVKSSTINLGNPAPFQAIVGTKLVNTVMTPLLSALLTFLNICSSGLAVTSPPTAAAASACAVIVAQAQSSMTGTLSTVVKMA